MDLFVKQNSNYKMAIWKPSALGSNCSQQTDALIMQQHV